MHPRAAVPLVLCALAACGGVGGSGGSQSPPTAPTSLDNGGEGFPADAGAARYRPIHRATFGPWWGSGCPDNGACGCGDARTLAEEFTCQMNQLSANGIPITAYLFDGHAWSLGSSDTTNACSGAECCSWKLGDEVVQRLDRDGVRGLLHFWGGCHDPEQYERARTRLGRSLFGFYLDDGSSDEELRAASEFMQSAIPGDWECVAKAFQNREPSTTDAGLSKWANTAYVGDLPYDYDGLKEAVTRIQAKAVYIPAPYAELTGYAFLDGGMPDEDVYYRRLHFGALQPVMAHTPYANSDPWRREYGPDLVRTYRYWAWLHTELVPYFYSYAYRMWETPDRPLLRKGPMTYSLRVGNELYAPIVTEATDTMDVRLPYGQWIDYWDESRLVSGMLAAFPAPLGREPIFIRQGSILPMDVRNAATGHGTAQSSGALTVLVYPSGTSSFRYREDALTPWITFTSALEDDRLTLTAGPGLPERPVLYRVGRWDSAPASVGIEGATVTVNQGGDVPRLPTEAAVNGSRASAWFHDAAGRRLVIKVAP
jgi:hypothetical protein